MIFKQWQQVLDESKTQTRRLVKEGDRQSAECMVPVRIYANRRLKWQVGRTYAVQPGRGKKAVGRIRVTSIQRARAQDITPEDISAEGIPLAGFCADNIDLLTAIALQYEVWVELWDSIHKKPGTRHADNPEVWVLEFEVVAQEAA